MSVSLFTFEYLQNDISPHNNEHEFVVQFIILCFQTKTDTDFDIMGHDEHL